MNAASDELILAFLQSQEVSQDAASSLLVELREWQAGGQKMIPGNSPPQSLEEIRQIPSWKAQSRDCWMDSLTVYTGQPGIDMADATPMTLAALRWAQEHHLGNRDWIAAPAAVGATAARSAVGEVLRIRATATVSKEIRATSEWVGRLTGGRQRPILTMRWDHDTPADARACGN